MGEDVDFFEQPAWTVGIAHKLRALKDPPRDADALATLLDRYCGHALELGLQNFEKNYARERAKTEKLLQRMRKDANELIADGGDSVFAYSLTIDELLPEHAGFAERQRLKKDILAAVMTLWGLPVLSKPAGRPLADRVARQVIRAIREYWETHEGPFSGGPKRNADQTWAENAVERGSPATRLVGQVLDMLNLHLDPGPLNERMRSVRDEPRWF
ncbi:MAG TPA: hypothetical protein VGR19_12560 [Allosphingosinicella sp.]|nr:hypothetical protein [Allosphingosinicella sp.]